MSKPQPFVVPEGVVFNIGDDGVTIENRGDIVLHTNFGRTLKSIVSHEGSIEIHAAVSGGSVHAGGDVSLHGDASAAEIHAGGAVSVHGNAKAESVQAGGDVAIHGHADLGRVQAGGGVMITGDVHGGRVAAGGSVDVGGAATVEGILAGGAVNLAGDVTTGTVRGDTISLKGARISGKGFQANHAVHVGAAKLQVDALIAPEVHLDPKTSGRCTVIESQNDLGTNAIKGGFRLADYGEMFGDPTSFLSERGLNALGDVPAMPPPVAPRARSPKAAPENEAVSIAPVEPEIIESEPPDDDAHVIRADTEVVEDDRSAPAAAPVPVVPEHPLHKQLVDAVTKIAECYADAEVPPSVMHLRELIDTHQYDTVRGEITGIWSDLLKFHQKKGMRIQHQVTTTFNTINSLVKKM